MVMISDILLPLKISLEASLQGIQSRDEDWLLFTNLFTASGSLAPDVDDAIVMSVASLQSDVSLNAYKANVPGKGDVYPVGTAPLFLDVYLMFVSTFSGPNYPAGLSALSRIVTYFQERPVIEPRQSGPIGDAMGRLAIEFANLDFAAAAHLATLTGIKGLPFVLYRLRRLPFDGPAISDVAPPVVGTSGPGLRPY